MYHIDLKHDRLKKFQRLSGADQYVLEQRARVQTEAWDRCWRRRALLDLHSDELLRHLPNFEAKKAYAAKETNAAQRAIASLGDILPRGLKAAPFKMEMLYDCAIFPEPRPVPPADHEPPPEPMRSDPAFTVAEHDPLEEFWALVFPSVKQKLEKEAQAREVVAQSKYELAHRSWQETKDEIAYLNAKAAFLFEIGLDEWWARAQAYQKQQRDENGQIDKFRLRYARGVPDAVTEFLDSALSQSEYPDLFPTQWEMDFETETGALIVDYGLPSPDKFPTLKDVRYDLLRDTFEQSYLSEAEIAQLYESAIYQTCLRTLHNLFAADEADVIAQVTFNGWVNFSDKVDGKPARACIMSVQLAKAVMKQVDLATVDPKTCFAAFQGVAGERLADISAVTPISQSKRTDDWLVPANDVVETVWKQPL